MFVDELVRINESESKAEELQKKARIDSKQTLEDARAKAEQIIEEAEARAKSVYDEHVKEGQLTSEEQYEAFLEETRQDCIQMIKHAKGSENKAIKLIAERIVSISVDH